MTSRGFTSIQWLVGLALIALPAAAAPLSLWVWYEGSAAASAAARTAVRRAALAGDAAGAAAEVAATAEMVNRARSADQQIRLELRLDAEGFTRGAIVEVIAEVDLPALSLPGLGSLGAVGHSVSHRERLDPYRSFP